MKPLEERLNVFYQVFVSGTARIYEKAEIMLGIARRKNLAFVAYGADVALEGFRYAWESVANFSFSPEAWLPTPSIAHRPTVCPHIFPRQEQKKQAMLLL